MATQVTTSFTDGTSSDAIQSVLNSVLLERGVFDMTATVPVMAKPMSQRTGKTMIWRRYEALSLAKTALSEGVTPSGKAKSVTDVSATLAPYGDYIIDSDFLLNTQPEAVAIENVELLGQQRGETMNSLYLDEWATATNILYANGSATNAVNTVLDETDFRRALRDLRNNKAKVFTPMVDASQKIGTGSILPSFWCLTTPDVMFDMNDETDFITVNDYGNSNAAIAGEAGAFRRLGIRFLLTPNDGNQWTFGTGATGSTTVQESSNNAIIHSAFVIGRGAVGGVQLNIGNSKVITKGLGSSGTEDPLNQRASFGWILYDAREVLNQAFFTELQGAVTS